MRLKLLMASLSALCATAVLAEPADDIRASLSKLNLPVAIKTISESPISGVYQVQLDSGRILYASGDGQFLIQGALYDLSAAQPRNLTSAAEAAGIGEVVNGLPQDQLVIFAPDKPKTHVTVFTDVDCGYCRLLHSEVGKLNDLGIEVRYAAFPRSGPGQPSAKIMESIWCAEDRQEAMTEAKLGNKIETLTCDNPVNKQFALGQQVGVQGTPAIFMANGVLLPGYKPAAELAEQALANQ
ncbi:thioredoxin fold domain-containing protein [Halopseudomonas pelagia]|uniref:Thiol:disulfide interchange protein n=1 Tax=Halopseudomonas pelagia TaxID=553151 RepID=A0AA91U031_9GAMM|nr:thioredoxin fold domain-containing protein [Halopseudomonas pelagia]PCC97956.1 protein-disulfide isomerase [Halopseudomonas pelagia]QFY55949.1 protein-disulfide isomerase [Halopseudomonas pelagia]